jgi:hypothetical protein
MKPRRAIAVFASFPSLRTVFAFLVFLGAVAFACSPSGASAQATAECTSWSAAGYTDWQCVTFSGQSSYEFVSTTTQSCQLGWSHREASQTVTVTDTYVSNIYTWETWYIDDFTGEQRNYQTWTSSQSYQESSVTDVGQCAPIKGKPPQH